MEHLKIQNWSVRDMETHKKLCSELWYLIWTTHLWEPKINGDIADLKKQLCQKEPVFQSVSC